MEYANITTKYICPVDLHFDNMCISIMDRQGTIYQQKRLPINETVLLRSIDKYKSELTIACESVPNYYWLKDFSDKHGIVFALGHSQYMWKICTKKKKDDYIDTEGMGNLMNTHCYPQAYAYPRGNREMRDLLRERLRIVRLRAAAYTRIRLMSVQYGIALPEDYSVKRKSDRKEIIGLFVDKHTAMKAALNLEQIEQYDAHVRRIERQVRESIKSFMPQENKLLRSIPGTGPILAMTVLLEMHNWSRFASAQKFSSYCRVVHTQRISNGKRVDKKHQKIGNPYLKWAFSLMTIQAIKHSGEIKKLHNRLKNRHGKVKALAILRHRIAVAVYMMLKGQRCFDTELFIRIGKMKKQKIESSK